jgi:competence protein CoiA
MMRLVDEGYAAAIGKEEWILLSEPSNEKAEGNHSCFG